MVKCKFNPAKECNCIEKCKVENPIHETPFSRKAYDEVKEYRLADGHMVGSSKYKEMRLEPWKEMEMSETKEDFLTYLRLAAKKHQLRLGRKVGSNILEDMEKAEHIIQKWIEVYKSD